MTERRKPTYTRKLHAYRVELMLNKPGELCKRCPATRGFVCGTQTMLLSQARLVYCNRNEVCNVCQQFVCINVPGYDDKEPTKCPCCQFGGELAIKRTLAALKKERQHDK